jgi:hypothetical protein
MTQRQVAAPAPGPLEAYAQQFADLFGKRSQREAFRRYLAGLLLPAERNKTLTWDCYFDVAPPGRRLIG